MRHVFFLHSHITWLVARAVIRHHGVAPADVLLVCTRGYRPPDASYPTKVFPDRRWVITWRLDRWWRLQRELARFVDEVAAGGEFTWYLPHTAFPFFRAFVRHPACRGFSLIEEGLAAYYTPEAANAALRRVASSRFGWRRWAARAWVWLRPPVFADPRYLQAYGCTDEAFPGYARRTRVHIEERVPEGGEEVRAVVAFDAVLEAQVAGEAAFFQSLEELMARLAEAGHAHVHYKLHPQQYIDARYRPQLVQALQGNRHGLRFTELPADSCLELLAQGGRTDFYVFVSSIAIYASASGCKVYSMSRRLAELDPQYRRVVDAIPVGVRGKMRFL